MLKSFLSKIHANRILQTIAIVTAVVLTAGVFSFITAGRATAATNPVSINMIYYGTNSNATDQSIIDANPEYLVNNSPAGPWHGNADINKFTSAGIKYFDYIDGGYEGTVNMAIPNDLQSNLDYIEAIAAAGAYGVFVDEVSPYPSAAALDYLKQLADKAHSLGLKVVFNVGVDSWSDSLMEYCDYINSSEIWSNAPLTASQTKWASQTWFLTQGVNDATTAADLTNAALNQGIDALYACTSYMALPSWLDSYVALIATAAAPAIEVEEPITTPIPTPETEPAPILTPETEPAPTTTLETEPAPIPALEPVVAPAPTLEPEDTPAPVLTEPSNVPALVTAPTNTPAMVTEPAPMPAPETTTVIAPEPAPAPTTIVTAITPPAVEVNATPNFFAGVWQSVQSIWAHITNWFGF